MNESESKSQKNDLGEYLDQFMSSPLRQLSATQLDKRDTLSSQQNENFKNLLGKIIDSEEKYQFLINNVDEITFKHNIIEYEHQHLIQEITKDILGAACKKNSGDEWFKEKLEAHVRQIVESEEKYRFLIEHIEGIIFICDENYSFTFLSPQWYSSLGYLESESLGVSLFEFVHESDSSLMKEKFHRLFNESVKLINFEYRLRDKKGNWKYHLLTGTPIRNSQGKVSEILAVSYDITERKVLQQKIRDFNEQLERRVRERTQEINTAYEELQKINTKLIQSEKMAAIGELCSGIAHEFNNLIGIMQAYAEFTRSQPSEKNIQKLIDAVLLSAKRAKTITQSLLSFARRIEPLQELSSINDAIDDVLLLMDTDLRKANIAVIKEFDPTLPLIIFDLGQIEQVMLNLLVNAKHAFYEKSGNNKIIIKSTQSEENIIISVSDNGIGIKEEHLEKIFQPFFSTKGPYGKSKIPGTGLGLSVSLGIIENHNGTLSVESKENVGTTFTITLPKKSEAKPITQMSKMMNAQYTTNNHTNLRIDHALPTSHPYRKSATILIVDDEEYLRNALCGILSAEGYNLIPAEDGETAIDIFKHTHFDLVLMDIMMPGIDGFETIKILRTIKPDVKIIILSGSTHCITDSLQINDIQGIIFKPFELDKLMSLISNVLEEKLMTQ